MHNKVGILSHDDGTFSWYVRNPLNGRSMYDNERYDHPQQAANAAHRARHSWRCI